MPTRIIEYRAEVEGVLIDGRSLQIITKSVKDFSDWAKIQTKIHNKNVKVWIVRENILKIFKPKYVKKGDNDGTCGFTNAADKIPDVVFDKFIPGPCYLCGTKNCQSHYQDALDHLKFKENRL